MHCDAVKRKWNFVVNPSLSFPLLARYRARLAANRATHPLFDMARFAHALDDLLQAAWENRSSPMPSSIAS